MTGAPALAAHVHWGRIEDTIFVMDLRVGRYFALDAESSAAFLDLTCGRPVVAAVLREFERQGWLSPAPSPPVPRPVRRAPLADLSALACLRQARRHLAKAGLWPTLCWAQAHHAHRDRADVLPAFQRAEALSPGPRGDRDCLPRSLGLFSFLRLYGAAPQMVVGLRRHPFTAHAWVELDGAALLQPEVRQANLSSFTEILRMS